MRTILRNNKKGGALAFSVVLIIVLLMVGIAFFLISLYFGGAQETKDAVNAGALNVAKKALDITVPLGGGDEQFFADVADNGNVSLRNINRVWSKALFVAVNAEGAQKDGGHEGSGDSSAQAAHQAAKSISDALAAKLSTPTELYGFFDDYAKANSVRMLGTQAQVEKLPGADWNTAFLRKDFESNIQFMDNLPPNYSNSALFTASKRNPIPQDAQGKQYVVGYKPLHVMNLDFWNVPYPFEQHPHVVDRKYYDDNKTKPLQSGGASWDKPVPNAFGVAGGTKKSVTYDETAVSWVETNPQKVFPMQFPHGFIRVILKKNTLGWCLDFPAEDAAIQKQDYKFELMDSHDSIPFPTGCGEVRGTCYAGNEYPLGTLYNGICALPTTGGSDPLSGNAFDYMLQRVKEMVPGYTKAQFLAKLNTTFISHDADDQTFFIYPNSDNSDITISAENSASLPSGCNKDAKPDGTQQTLDTEIPVPMLNFATFTFDCYGSWGPYPTYSQVHAERKWKPGSGWDGGCLGELEVHRHTEAVLPTIPCVCP
jgi:hypothetical protein